MEILSLRDVRPPRSGIKGWHQSSEGLLEGVFFFQAPPTRYFILILHAIIIKAVESKHCRAGGNLAISFLISSTLQTGICIHRLFKNLNICLEIVGTQPKA